MFWLAILISAGCAVLAIKHGFYAVWPILFNILVSVFLGVMLCPTIIGLIPDIGSSRYHHAGCVGGVAIVIFAILQTITVNFLAATSGQENEDGLEVELSFPHLVNTIGAGALGFISGYIVCGFVLFLLMIMPVSKVKIVKGFCEKSKFAKQTVKNTCGFMGGISLQYYGHAGPEAVVEWLATEEHKKEEPAPDDTKQEKTSGDNDPSEKGV